MIMVGFHGREAGDSRFRDILRQLEAGLIGGVLFLGHNMATRDEVLRMTAAVKACKSRHAPLIAIDQEGGRIQRLGPDQGFTAFPSARAVAAQDDTAARETYGRLAAELARAGFNMNFAPVVDLDINPINPVIGRLERSFSIDPDVVHRFARQFIKRHRAAGLLTSLKHFPGHGSSFGDTHRDAVDVTYLWSEAELAPYRKLIAEGLADSVMVGHLRGAAWGGVASQSPAHAISRFLRRDLGFRGVVITDDLEMDAVHGSTPDFGDVVLRAVEAGADIVLVSNYKFDRPRLGDWLHAMIAEAASRKQDIAAAVDASYARITAMKSSLPLT